MLKCLARFDRCRTRMDRALTSISHSASLSVETSAHMPHAWGTTAETPRPSLARQPLHSTQALRL